MGELYISAVGSYIYQESLQISLLVYYLLTIQSNVQWEGCDHSPGATDRNGLLPHCRYRRLPDTAI